MENAQNEKITETIITEIEKEIPTKKEEVEKPHIEIKKENLTQKQIMRNFIG